MKRVQAFRKASTALRSPKPYTSSPSSRRRWASRVKSLSELTSTTPSRMRLYIRSMASITSAMSEAFLPFELLRCWCWRIASDFIAPSQPDEPGTPKSRRRCVAHWPRPA